MSIASWRLRIRPATGEGGACAGRAPCARVSGGTNQAARPRVRDIATSRVRRAPLIANLLLLEGVPVARAYYSTGARDAKSRKKMLLIATEQAPHFGPQILQLMPDLFRPGQLLRRQHRANLQGHLKRLLGELDAELPDLLHEGRDVVGLERARRVELLSQLLVRASELGQEGTKLGLMGSNDLLHLGLLGLREAYPLHDEGQAHREATSVAPPPLPSQPPPLLGERRARPEPPPPHPPSPPPGSAASSDGRASTAPNAFPSSPVDESTMETCSRKARVSEGRMGD